MAGVIGWPVAHSRSPRLHTYWLARYGIDGAYVRLPVAPGEFAQALQALVAAGFAGANVTIPHKEAALEACDVLEASAVRAGAVNTLVFEAGRVRGSNTDGAGFMANLAAHGVPHGGSALILGAGGAGRAVAAALLDAGYAARLCNRTEARAVALAAALPGLEVIAWGRRHAALAGRTLVVNATPAGMRGQDEAGLLDLAAAPAGLAVADLVYVPLETPLLAQARRWGLRVVPGLGMLVRQAVPGFAAWFGVVPEVDQAVLDLLAADIAGG